MERKRPVELGLRSRVAWPACGIQDEHSAGWAGLIALSLEDDQGADEQQQTEHNGDGLGERAHGAGDQSGGANSQHRRIMCQTRVLRKRGLRYSCNTASAGRRHVLQATT